MTEKVLTMPALCATHSWKSYIDGDVQGVTGINKGCKKKKKSLTNKLSVWRGYQTVRW